MSIEQHAEAAAKDIDKLAQGSMYETFGFEAGKLEELVSRHIQAAIDEATATLKARVAALEGLGPLIDDLRELTALHADYVRRGIDGEALRWRIELESVAAKITAILKGGA